MNPSPVETAPELGWPWPTVELATRNIHLVRFPQDFTDNRIESSGALAVFTEPFSSDSLAPIWLANLVTGTLTKIYSPPMPVSIFEPVISDQTVAWMESEGSSSWRVMAMDLATGVAITIATFHAPTSRAGVIRIDGNYLAYVVPAEAGNGDTIRLLSLSPLRTIRTVQRSAGIFKLALAGMNLFWSEGEFSPAPQLSFHDASAWVSTASDPTPSKVANDAYELGFDGTWMTWVRDPSESGQGNQILARQMGQAAPIVLSPEPAINSPGGLYASVWPSVGDGIVAWSIDGPQDFALSVWPVGSSTPVGIRGTPLQSVAIAGTSVNAGWLDWNQGQGIGGARVEDILAAIRVAHIR